MAKNNTHQLPLNPAEKMRLQEAYNLMVYGSENNNKIMVKAGQMTWELTEGDPRKSEAFAEFQKTLTLDEDFTRIVLTSSMVLSRSVSTAQPVLGEDQFSLSADIRPKKPMR